MEDIYETYTAGSEGFCKAVETLGYDMSLEEIERIGKTAATAEEFQRIWENETWWTDDEANDA